MDLYLCQFWKIRIFPSLTSSYMPNVNCLARAFQQLWPWNRNQRRRPAAILDFDFVNFGNSALFASWISSSVPNLKWLARAVQNLRPWSRNPWWRPAAILHFSLSILVIPPLFPLRSLALCKTWCLTRARQKLWPYNMKSNFTTGGHHGLWYLSILLVLSYPRRGYLVTCIIRV